MCKLYHLLATLEAIKNNDLSILSDFNYIAGTNPSMGTINQKNLMTVFANNSTPINKRFFRPSKYKFKDVIRGMGNLRLSMVGISQRDRRGFDDKFSSFVLASE